MAPTPVTPPTGPRRSWPTSSALLALLLALPGFGDNLEGTPLPDLVVRLRDGVDPPAKRVELGRTVLARLEAAPDPEARRTVGLSIVIALVDLERFREAHEQATATADLSRQEEDPLTLAHCLWLQGLSAFHLGKLRDAERSTQEGMEVAASIQRADLEWRTANMLGLTRERLGDSTAALEAFSRGLEVAERIGDVPAMAVLHSNIGIAYMNVGELLQALEFFELAYELEVEAGSEAGLPSSLANLGDAYVLLEEFEKAYDYHLEALELRQEIGSEVELSLSYHSMGVIHAALEDHELALDYFEKAREIRERLHLAPELATTLAAMAMTYAVLDRGAEALVSVQQGLDMTEQLELAGRRLLVLESLARLHEELGDYAEAFRVLGEFRELEDLQRSAATQRQFVEFRTRFEAREQEQQIALLEQEQHIALLEREQQITLLEQERELQGMELRRQRLVRNGLVTGAVFLSAAALAGWWAWAALRRASRKIEELEKNRARVEKLESIGVLAGGIAHDFNNILAAVVGNLSVAQAMAASDAEMTDVLQDSDQALEQGRRLATQLLGLARGGTARHELTSLAPVLQESSDLAIAGSTSRVELDVPPDLWCANVDVVQIRQLFSNLVLNAAQATPGGGTIRVRAENVELDGGSDSSVPAGPCLRVSVLDQGCGVDPAIRDKVFDPYFTTKEVGSGLGLALAYAIVSRHHGAISLRPNPGGGTTFEVLLPAVKEGTAPVAPAERFTAPDSIRPGTGNVLVMDDEPLVRRFYERALTRLGYSFTVAPDGESAVNQFQRARRDGNSFQVAILDLTIAGGMGGRETFEQLRRLEPDLPGIVATGYSNDPMLESYQDAGFAGALVKPFTIASLSVALERAIAQHS